ncbi:hypothetical protein [Saccharomonospora iraqiensis]|uniref:hypothetical protein n=1 Tax=Saccharomonospora iraqiensis TaxID=52698 RepID=UPI00022DF887|nr:hypothetical protein [Saccharomonospora iraqiensis]
MSDEDGQVRAVCTGCGGDGQVAEPELAVLNGVGQTVLTLRRCRWCDGEGRRPMHPPL